VRLTAMITEAGLIPCGGTDLYLLIQDKDAKALHQHLARLGIWTRVFTYNLEWIFFGLPAHEGEWNRLQSALKSWRQDGN